MLPTYARKSIIRRKPSQIRSENVPITIEKPPIVSLALDRFITREREKMEPKQASTWHIVRLPLWVWIFVSESIRSKPQSLPRALIIGKGEPKVIWIRRQQTFKAKFRPTLADSEPVCLVAPMATVPAQWVRGLTRLCHCRVADREATHTVEVTNRRGLGRARQASIGRNYTEVFLAFEGSLSGQDKHDHTRFAWDV